MRRSPGPFDSCSEPEDDYAYELLGRLNSDDGTTFHPDWDPVFGCPGKPEFAWLGGHYSIMDEMEMGGWS